MDYNSNQNPPYYNQGQQGQNPYNNPNQQGGMPPMKPDNNMVWAILTTILCCLPFGIVSIVYANKVDSLWFQGFYQEAYDNSRKARNWAIAAAITGPVLGILYTVIMFAFVGAAGLYDI